MTPFFLFHQSRTGGDASYVERFFADVQREVYRRLGHRAEFTGQLTAVHVTDAGDGVDVDSAVLSSPVLVALYSDSYFRDERRLQEWSLFRERVRWHRQFTGRNSPALVGVRWSVQQHTRLPPAVAKAGMLAGDFGDEYRESGASRLVRTDPTSGGYRLLVECVTEMIISAADDSIPPMSAEDLEFVRMVGMPDAVPPTRAHAGRPAVVPSGDNAQQAGLHNTAEMVTTASVSSAGMRSPDEAAHALHPGRPWEYRRRITDAEHTRRPILRNFGGRAGADNG